MITCFGEILRPKRFKVMEGRQFTVEEAASIMNCDRATVYRLVADGWLSGVAGRPNNPGSARVSKKSLYQFLIVDRLSLYPKRVLKKMTRQKNFENNSSQSPIANRFNSKGADTADASRDLTQVEGKNNSSKPVRCLHHDFVEQNHKFFRRRARQLATGDRAFQDDLVQEMALAVLQYDKEASPELLFVLAENRAMDYIRYEAARGMLSLEQAQHVSDQSAEKIASLNQFIDELKQRGVPHEWIEEVIGWRLAAA